MAQSKKSKASEVFSAALSTSMGGIIGGPIGAATSATASWLDSKLGNESHFLARATVLTGLLTTAATVITGPLGWFGLAVAASTSTAVTHFSKDFLDNAEKINQIVKNAENVYSAYQAEHPEELEYLKSHPIEALKAIRTNPFAAKILYQQSLNALKLSSDMLAFYLLGAYLKGDFVITFLSNNEKHTTSMESVQECAGAIFVLTAKTFLDHKIDTIQSRLTAELRSYIEMCGVSITSNPHSVRQILHTEKGSEALPHIASIISNQMGTLSWDLSKLLTSKSGQLCGLSIVASQAPILIPLKYFVSQLELVLNKKISAQKNAHQAERDQLAIEMGLANAFLTEGAVDIFTSGMGEFASDSSRGLITRQRDLSLREQAESSSKDLQRLYITNGSKIADIAGFLASIYFNGLNISQITLLQPQLKEVNNMLSGAGSFPTLVQNQDKVEKALNALTQDIQPPIRTKPSEDGNINFKDFKLFIEGDLRFHIDGRILPGQHVVLNGPSGSGKSTMIKALFGQSSSSAHTEGEIELPCENGSKDMLLVSQKVLLVPKKTLFENIVLRQKSEMTENEIASSKALIIELLEKMQINNVGELSEQLESNDFSWISGGQLKKIALARAILQNPKLLFLDETFTGMDLESLQASCRILSESLPNAIIVSVDHDGALNKAGFYNAMLDLRTQPAMMIPFNGALAQPQYNPENIEYTTINKLSFNSLANFIIHRDLKILVKEIVAEGGAFSTSLNTHGDIEVNIVEGAGSELVLSRATNLKLTPAMMLSHITTTPDCACEIRLEADGIHLIGVAAPAA